MALIKCPECGKEMSDQAKACPNCGYKEKKKFDAKMIKFLVIGVVALALIAIAIVVVTNKITKNNEAKAAQYEKDCKEFAVQVLAAQVPVDDYIGMAKKVWYNAINEIDDTETFKYVCEEVGDKWMEHSDNVRYRSFSDAIDKYNSDVYQVDARKKIKENTDKLSQSLKKLNDCPESCQKLNETIKNLYKSYLSYEGLVLDISGSYTSYCNATNDAQTDLKKQYDALVAELH